MSKIYLNIAIIGAGKIAYSLVSSLIDSRFVVSIIISKNISSAEKLARKFGVKKYSDDFRDIPISCNAFFLCIPDSQLNLVAKILSKRKFNFRNSLFVHMSGALTTSVLDALDKKKALTASFHIMQTFPSKKTIRISKIYVAIETNSEQAERTLFSLANELGLIPFKLMDRNKIFYHLAAVHASNFLVGNIFNSQRLFDNAKVKGVDFREIMFPIISSTFSNIKKYGASKSLSGPIERGELQIIKKHLNALKKIKNTTRVNIEALNYISQSLSLLALIEQSGVKLSTVQDIICEYLLIELKSISSKI